MKLLHKCLYVSALLLCAIALQATVWPGSSLNNFPIGGQWNIQVGLAFKAPVNAPVGAIRIYEITQGAGYAGGDGGRIKYELYGDANGEPGSLIAGGVMLDDPQYTQWLNKGGFPLISFPTTPILTAGNWYHLVMTNVDADPITNFVSWDGMLSSTGTNPDPNSRVEYRAAGDNWKVDPATMVEPFAVFMADGTKWGNGGYQVQFSSNAARTTLCGSAYGFVC